MLRLSKSLIGLSFAAIGFTTLPCMANETNGTNQPNESNETIQFKSFFCTSALNAPNGVTTLTYTGRNPLNGKETFQLSNTPLTGIPFSQSMILSKFSHSGPSLLLNFHSLITNSDFSLSMNSTTNSIQLSAGSAAALEMTCQVNIDLPN